MSAACSHTAIESRDAIQDPWGARSPYGQGSAWPTRIDEYTTEKPERWTRSACILCSNGCGISVGVAANRIVSVRGVADDRVNRGRLGPKGLYGWQSIYATDRLMYPQIRRDGQLGRASWDQAMSLIVGKIQDAIDRFGRLSVAHYTSGQLFLEEYHALAMIGKAGLRNLHMDGNTRLCTATAAAAMRESFGSDGQPGSYDDIDHCDTLFMVGHNMAETQSVLWQRILDRLDGPDPPKLIVVDPRSTPTSKRATVHLAIHPGTNLALMNGLQQAYIDRGVVDWDYVNKHTVGIEDVKRVCRDYPLNRVSEICKVSVEDLERCVEVLSSSSRCLHTCLQGVYQANQATSSACAVNNLALLRGMIGRPGAGVLQFNGQPTAQNNREAGCNGEYPGFRNPLNPNHMQDLADHWQIKVENLPHYNQPTRVMQMLQYMEEGSIRVLWISGTNPAVSLPELRRIKSILRNQDLFVIVQDVFPNETTELADVVLPAAMWGEKTGCFTNVDRTVHLSEKAVDPPGECKSDFDIWLDFANRMNFRNRNGEPLLSFTDAEGAFESWKTSTRGRLCDYTGLSYAKLREKNGIQWPCNEENPDGTSRLYVDGVFPTDIEHCESYGHDHWLGVPLSKKEYAQLRPEGRAILKAAPYRPAAESPNQQFPLALTTGRRIYHFHTRTKTARAPKLNAAAKEVWVEVSHNDAERYGVSDGQKVIVRSPRGRMVAVCRVKNVPEGTIFVPFHYGNTLAETEGRGRVGTAANNLTLTAWDFISKQPLLKGGIAAIEPVPHAQDSVELEKEEYIRPEPRHKGIGIPLLGHFLAAFAQTSVQVQEELAVLAHRYSEKDYETWAALNMMQEQLKMLSEAVMVASPQEPTPNEDLINSGLFAYSKVTETSPPSIAKLLDHGALSMHLQGLCAFLQTILPASKALASAQLSVAVQDAIEGLSKMIQWCMNRLKIMGPQALLVPPSQP